MMVVDATTFAFALLGAVLGVINLWREIDRSRMKLRVIPTGWFDTEGNTGICIQVINLSEYAVTITGVGIRLRDAEKREWHFVDRTIRLPHRLQPREAITLRAPAGAHHDDELRKLGDRAFARTACGHDATGTSPYLRSLFRR